MTARRNAVPMYEEKAGPGEKGMDPKYVTQSEFRVKYSDDNISLSLQ